VRGVSRLQRQESLNELEPAAGSSEFLRRSERGMSEQRCNGTLGQWPRHPTSHELACYDTGIGTEQ
jgi:hypothetical protein